MDFLFELLFEIIIEGSVELGTHHKVPMFIRILASLLFIAFYGFIIVALFLVGFGAAKDGNTPVAIIFYIVDAFILIGCIYMFRKKYKENRQ